MSTHAGLRGPRPLHGGGAAARRSVRAESPRRWRTSAMLAAVAVLAALAPAGARTRRVPLAETIGVNTHYGAPREPVDPAALARLAAAGVRWIRNDLDWATVEQAPGVYDFTTPGFDALVAEAERWSLRILFILDFGNPLYEPGRAVTTEAGRQAFAAYAAAAAARYGGRGHAWEIWNEPNLPLFWSGPGTRPDAETYARLVAATAPALRAADPTGPVLIGSAFMGLPSVVEAIGGVAGLAFLERLFASGVQAQVDGVTAHFYRAEPPETVAAEVAAIRRLMKATGRVLPLWSGEWGYSTYDPAAPPTGINYLPAVTPDRQAAYVARMLLWNHALGLAGSIYFKDTEAAAADPGNIEHHFGLVHHDGTPKPAYGALATLTRLVGDGRLRRRLALGDGAHGLVFRTRAGRVIALWAEQAATFRLRARRRGAKVVARDGADVTPADLSSVASFTLDADEGPVYVLGPVAIRAPEPRAPRRARESRS